MRSRCSGPKPFGALSLNAEAIVRGGLLSGRQMRSPSPFHIARPSESWTSGRQSTAVCLRVSENQNIDVDWRDRKSTRLNSKSLMRISYAVFCLKKKKKYKTINEITRKSNKKEEHVRIN